MPALIHAASAFLILTGCVFCLIGAFGILKMPSFITRVHASSLIDSLGAILIIGGLILYTGFTLVAIKLIMILLFLLVTGPTAIHALVNAAIHEDPSYITDKESPSKT